MILDDQMCLEKENNENSLSIKLNCVAKELKSGVRCLIRQSSGLPLNFREVWKLCLLVLCLVATAPIRQKLQLLLWGQTHSQSILRIYFSMVSWEDYSVRFNPFLIKHLKYTSVAVHAVGVAARADYNQYLQFGNTGVSSASLWSKHPYRNCKMLLCRWYILAVGNLLFDKQKA